MGSSIRSMRLYCSNCEAAESDTGPAGGSADVDSAIVCLTCMDFRRRRKPWRHSWQIPIRRAYEKLVDRLLDSPRYGERWARHWLDTVHFADSHGCEHDVFRPNAWRYRDYVIASFNRDTPWDRFIREQLAADRFYPDETELTTALGFIAAGPLGAESCRAPHRSHSIISIATTWSRQTMAAFASTTANCARCHNHKFDPITQEDYYSLQAVFAGTGKGDVEFDEDPVVASERRRWNALLAASKHATGRSFSHPSTRKLCPNGNRSSATNRPPGNHCRRRRFCRPTARH